MKYLLIILLFWTSVYAASPIKEGDPAPHSGVIFTTEEGRDLVANDKKRIKLEQLQIKYEDKIELQEQRIDLLKKHIKDQDNLSSFGKVTWFFIGFISSGVIMYYSAQIVKDASK